MPVAGKFGGQAMTYYGRWTYKFEEAARRGAIGALVVHETAGAGYGWNTVQAPGGENYNVVLGRGARQPVLLQGWIQRAVAADLFRRAGLDFEAVKRQRPDRGFPPDRPRRDLLGRLAGDDRAGSRATTSSPSCPARSDPSETIMFAAPLGRLRDRRAPTRRAARSAPAPPTTRIGVAGVIEIARAFAAGPRPERTLLFAAWTAEERGLLGSEYYAANPLYPPETMVANLTLDMLQTAGPARDVVLIGEGQNELEDMLAPPRRHRAAPSPRTRSRSAASSTAPTISRSPSAACRCCC